MNRLTRLFWTAKAVGWENVPRRLWHAWRVKSGAIRRHTNPSLYSDQAFRKDCPEEISKQSIRWHERLTRFFPIPNSGSLKSVADDTIWEPHVLQVCEQALHGKYTFFGHWMGELGWPPNFNHDPVHDIDWPVGEHWTHTTRSGPPRHDIKLVWEPNRLSLVYLLARAYRYDRSERWADAIWTMFDAWIEQNPPQLTVAWGCGQETAFRLMAMLTGAFATLDSPHATDDRLHSLTRFVWQSAHRIESNINFAISIKNNHALSEALGLWSIGLLFPEFDKSDRWKSTGKRVLEKECKRQIYDDGSFVQHSLNYHRVMLDDLMWCIRLGEINSEPLPNPVLDRFRLATDWLAEMTDPISGRVPNYGCNDGANVLPLACADYLDFRPTLQAANWIAHHSRCLMTGPWDEKLLWLCGENALAGATSPIKRDDYWSAPIGGYHVLRGPNAWLMSRCGTYRDRPHQADMLHVDLWYKGRNILRDAGSFLYYHEIPSWNHYFHSTAAHNTIEIDDQDQMLKGPRFLWFHWSQARVIPQGDSPGNQLHLQNQSYTWLHPRVQHERVIRRNGDSFTVCDRLRSNGQHEARLRWRLIDVPWERGERDSHMFRAEIEGAVVFIDVQCDSPNHIRLVSGQSDPPEGWESLYYGRKQSSPTVIATAKFCGELTFTTTIRFQSD